MGYLAQPHTSGGRVPTDRGYRYYVEGLMDEPAVPVDEQRTIAHQFHQVQMDSTEWLRLSAAILAQQVQNAALITAPRMAESRVKHLELISIQDAVALLVLVLQVDSYISRWSAPRCPRPRMFSRVPPLH